MARFAQIRELRKHLAAAHGLDAALDTVREEFPSWEGRYRHGSYCGSRFDGAFMFVTLCGLCSPESHIWKQEDIELIPVMVML